MKQLVTMLAFCVAVTQLGQAQGQHRRAATNQSTGQMLIDLEKSTWVLYKNKDVKAFEALTTSDFYDIYSDGVVVNRERWLKDMMDAEVQDSTLTDFHVIMLNKDAAIIVYTAVAHALFRGKQQTIHNAVTSGWGKRNGKWLNVFYRENVIAEKQ